ncbi:diguanylate cyclase [Shewanella maritima]|uniref:tetratricopeptide repeat-containing diguanylate cyclase n=1 Tax=Shewanella maritima TaxID=2520507 RepID=UPI0037356E20
MLNIHIRLLQASILAFYIISMSVTFASPANQARADELIELFYQGLVEDNDKVLLDELKMLVQVNDTERHKQVVRIQCWYQDNNTTEEINAAIAHASKQILLYSDPFPSPILADLHLCRGWFNQLNSNMDEAFADLELGINSAYQLENARLIADGRSIRGTMYSYQGSYSAALEDLITAQQLYESLNAPYWKTYNLSELAATYRRFGDPVTALKYQKQLESHYLENNQQYDANEVSTQIGFSLEELGQYQEAITRFDKSRQFWLKNDSPEMAADMTVSMAGSQIKLGQFAQAKSLLLDARNILPDDYDSSLSYLYMYLAYVYENEQDFTAALMNADLAINHFNTSNNERGISESYKLKSDILRAKQHWQQAYQQLSQFVDLHLEMDKKNIAERNAEMQARFDTNKIKNENELLIESAKIKEQQIEIMQRNDLLQIAVIVLSIVILIFVSIFAYKQLLRKRTFRHLALTDELTGLSNRRDTYNQANLFLKQAKVNQKSFSVISFDADHFKKVNDQLGHEVGDIVLVKLAELTRTMMRDSDVVGRVGGEEFLVLLPNINKVTAVEIAHRLVDRIAQYDWQQIDPRLQQTISAGVSEYDNEEQLSPLLLKVDEALYSAKAAGRNCVKQV